MHKATAVQPQAWSRTPLAHTAALQVAIKFFASQARFQHERTFYETRAALDGDTKWQAVPELMAAFAGPAAIETATGTPAALVLEAGEFNMQVGSTPTPHGVAIRWTPVFNITTLCADHVRQSAIAHASWCLTPGWALARAWPQGHFDQT